MNFFDHKYKPPSSSPLTNTPKIAFQYAVKH